MSLEICFIAVLLLLLFAVFDLIVGVSNDAVNFLNSSIGSRVAPRHVIMIVASFGILAGVLFSGGMMEVARKGIFHPQLFTMPELISLFLAVMLADVILLDLFNTHGIPTSTTVSIVFELLGAAVALALIKVLTSGGNLSDLANYINSAKALTIVFGILLSVVIAFFAGSIVQFFVRLAFTFDYQKTLSKWGGIWGGISLAVITLFILLKGAKHASFLSPEDVKWIKNNSWLLLIGSFVVAGSIFQVLSVAFQINVLKPIVLIGTFALALAFAANDLVNFIGVPLAGYHSYVAAAASSDPLNVTMGALQGKVRSETYLLLLAGAIMVATLWVSKKARTVTETSVELSRQEEDGGERFESSALARVIVRMVSGFFIRARSFVPRNLRKFIKKRMNPNVYTSRAEGGNLPSFDLVRASVNLIVASAVVSFATSLKLPLSTTYVTFMVAMGSSFSDQAWGRETAVYRVTGVLTVVGCWFLTAVFAFSIAFIFASILYQLEVLGALLVFGFVFFSIWRSHRRHSDHRKSEEEEDIFNLKKITDAREALGRSFEHTGVLLRELRIGLNTTLSALFEQNLDVLRKQRRSTKKISSWADIITANVFKVLRLLSQEQIAQRPDFALTNRCLQNLAESYRGIAVRAYEHTRNHHKPLLSVQTTELGRVKESLTAILEGVETTLAQEHQIDLEGAKAKHAALVAQIEELGQKQTERVRNRSSKTRLTILYFAMLSDMERMSRQSIRLLEIYQQAAVDRGDSKELATR